VRGVAWGGEEEVKEEEVGLGEVGSAVEATVGVVEVREEEGSGEAVWEEVAVTARCSGTIR
jgi:hypothetical protein